MSNVFEDRNEWAPWEIEEMAERAESDAHQEAIDTPRPKVEVIKAPNGPALLYCGVQVNLSADQAFDIGFKLIEQAKEKVKVSERKDKLKTYTTAQIKKRYGLAQTTALIDSGFVWRKIESGQIKNVGFNQWVIRPDRAQAGPEVE